MESNKYHSTKSGTPQGGIISPLLANIALDGLEEVLGIKHYWHPDKRSPKGGFWGNNTNMVFVRYADDFVILTETEELARKCKDIITLELRDRGLELSDEKTKITHLITYADGVANI